MTDFQFLENYEAHVRSLMDNYPLSEAMDLAVGGGWDNVQKVEVAILKHFGLRGGMRLIDLGCGAGRLAQGLAKSDLMIEYLGLDVIQPLLDYARTISPPMYRFEMNRALSFPAEDLSTDVICAFSVFTHLLPEETYIYLEDARRVLREGGRFILSFLELNHSTHWLLFQTTVDDRKANARAQLNTFLARETIDTFAAHLGYVREVFISGDEAPWCPDGHPNSPTFGHANSST